MLKGYAPVLHSNLRFRFLVDYDLIVDENLSELAIVYRLVGISTAPPK